MGHLERAAPPKAPLNAAAAARAGAQHSGKRHRAQSDPSALFRGLFRRRYRKQRMITFSDYRIT